MDRQQALDILAANVWTRPQYYGGFNPEGDFVVVSQHRDSDSVTRSNWQVACRMLSSEFADGDDRPAAYEWRAGHWAVGWAEYLCVRADAPDAVLIEAAEIVASLADYPILDESHHSDLEYFEAAEYWERMSVRDRAHYCARCGVSLFAARHAHLPADDNGRLLEMLGGH